MEQVAWKWPSLPGCRAWKGVPGAEDTPAPNHSHVAAGKPMRCPSASEQLGAVSQHRSSLLSHPTPNSSPHVLSQRSSLEMSVADCSGTCIFWGMRAQFCEVCVNWGMGRQISLLCCCSQTGSMPTCGHTCEAGGVPPVDTAIQPSAGLEKLAPPLVLPPA